MNAELLNKIYKTLCENKDIKSSLLNIKKYVDYSFILLYFILILIIIILVITITLLLTIIYLFRKLD
jgi:hypothetical protein